MSQDKLRLKKTDWCLDLDSQVKNLMSFPMSILMKIRELLALMVNLTLSGDIKSPLTFNELWLQTSKLGAKPSSKLSFSAPPDLLKSSPKRTSDLLRLLCNQKPTPSLSDSPML